jgi:quercetin dioxygenase-like cupin family protein
MRYSRRDLALLVPALAAAPAKAAESPVLASKTYAYGDMPVSGNGPGRQRKVLDGKTTRGTGVEIHITELPPGAAPHPPHHHVHEELIFIREGTMEVTISGRVSRIGPGGVALVASNEEHGWKNVGTTRAEYLVLALNRE